MSSSQNIDVLLIEDNPGDARLTREAFKEGCIENELRIVPTAEEGLDALHQRGEFSDETRPDLVLLDLNLPGMNGDEMLAQVKEDEDLRQIPVVILTSSTAEEDVVRSYDSHSNAYLTKPVDPDEFVSLVRKFESFWLSLVKLPPSER